MSTSAQSVRPQEISVQPRAEQGENPFKEQIMRGEACFERGAYHEALEIFKMVLSADPNNVAALNDAGVTCTQLGMLAEGAGCFEHALHLQPGHENAFYGLVDLLVGEGELELAVEAFLAYQEPVQDSETKRRYTEVLEEAYRTLVG